MSNQQAIDRARGSLVNHKISVNTPHISTIESYIEIEKNNESDECISIKDVLVWLVRFEKPRGWIEFAVVQEDLEIIRVEASR